MEDLNSQQTKQRVYERIQQTIARKKRQMTQRIYLTVASLIIVTLSAVIYRQTSSPADLPNLSADQLYADISAGSVSINGRERQSIADIKPEDQLPLHIHRDSNMLVVTSRQSSRSKDDEIILRAGIGGLYKVILDDGSIVYLNSNSELRSSEIGRVSINGRERQSIADIKPEDQLPLHIHRDSNMLVVTSRQSSRSKDDEIILRAGIGGLYKVILDDGSIVYLNSNSELRYYGNLIEDRQVRLQGEAFFEVANRFKENRRQPFTVHTDQQEIEVLGTQFNVVSRENQEQTVLTEGSIRLKSLKKREENTLSPGDMVELSADGSLAKSKVPIEEYTAWKDGIIYFEDRSLMDILTELKRMYPVEITTKQVPQKKIHRIPKKRPTIVRHFGDDRAIRPAGCPTEKPRNYFFKIILGYLSEFDSLSIGTNSGPFILTDQLSRQT